MLRTQIFNGGNPMPVEWSLLLWNLAAVLGFMIAVWALSVAMKNASIADTFWGLGFVLVAWITFLAAEGYLGRRMLLTLLVTAWGLRLALHIGIRSWGKGEDRRYQTWRRQYGKRFWWVSLFTVFLLQGALLWVISLVAQVGQWSPKPDRFIWLDGAGLLIWAVGFFFEAVGDYQLAAFKKNPANKGKRWIRASGNTRGTPTTSGSASCGGASSLSLWPRPVPFGRSSALSPSLFCS
jgi:steroid 5-alpha reductase family enzyme